MTSIHFYDETADGLAPVAVSEAVRETLGDPPTLDTGLAWEAFQAGEPRLHADVHDADNPYNPDTTMDSEMYLPLGDHGIFIVSALNADTFGENDLTLVKLLAAITTRALDRTAHIQQLERQNDRLERFASVISHDLRNPLQVARGHLEQARTIHDSDHLDAVANAHDRMATLIEELLTLARKGESVNDTSEVALAEAVDTCWRNVASTEATLVTDTEWTVQADRSRLQQLLENLLRNAVEHGGDAVTITVGDLEAANGFYIEDDGPGIPDDERAAVFKSGYSTSTDGTGFGLAIVQEIVESHDWTITLCDGADSGARFEIAGVEGSR